MSDFYADKRYYIDLSKIVFSEYIDTPSNNRHMSIHFLSGETFSFNEKYEWQYNAFKALKLWHEKKIEEMQRLYL